MAEPELVSIYDALGDEEIRVLIITGINPIIRCALAKLPQAQIANRYYALSYSWGPNNFTSHININGHTFLVTPRLHETLRELFQYSQGFPSGGDPMMLWIDAICLNQKDEEEKSRQLPLMDAIYREAKQVLVYLGPAMLNSDLAIDAIPKLLDDLDRINQRVERQNLSEHGLDSEGGSLWRALGHLYRREWFERLWIWQEAVMAKREGDRDMIVIGCGSRWITWSEMSALTTAILEYNLLPTIRREHSDPEEKEGFFAIPQINNNRNSRFNNQAPLNICGLLRMARSRQCYQQVDRIWGVLGLMERGIRQRLQNTEIIRNSNTELGRARYWNTYIAFTQWLIQNSILSDEDLLCYLSMASSPERNERLPSWCPDWSTKQGIICNLTGNRAFKAGRPSHGQSQGNVPRISLASGNTRKINVPGFRLDTVHSVVDGCFVFSQFFSQQIGPHGAASQLLAWEKRCWQLTQQVYRSSDETTARENLWRTLIANSTQNLTQLCTEDLSQDYHRWKLHLQALREGREEPLFPGIEQRVPIEVYFKAVQAACTGRKFFSTVGGRVGLGPSDITVGDDVCVFYSGHPLYVLRPQDEGTEKVLVGDTYVHGLMTFEEILEGRREVRNPEVFVIQ